jgi:hypothetical protein
LIKFTVDNSIPRVPDPETMKGKLSLGEAPNIVERFSSESLKIETNSFEE